IVNYGVPNDGAAAVARRLVSAPIPVPLGVNLVETNTGQPAAPDAVIAGLAEAASHFNGRAGYLAINLNCPNTGGGVSPFDDEAKLRALLGACAAVPGLPPVFLKPTASADPGRIERVLEAAAGFDQVKGFIFNLPAGKGYDLRTPRAQVDPLPGTLCGPPTRARLDGAVAAWYSRMDRRRYIVIGSGGIASAADAYRKIRLGASLVQVYTALVYQGPGLVRRLNRGLVALLERDGLRSIGEAVGLGPD
ncbi:MAG: quinone-dependent dihydroorotate dehydrogenase, partial [Gemmatimonadota bacterium]